MDKKDLVFEIKPQYRVAYVLMNRFIDLLILLIVLAYLATRPNMLLTTILSAIIIFIGIFIYIALSRKHNNRYYYYRFYPDRLVYRNSFLNKKVKEIMYKDIKDVRYSRTFWQTIFKIGDITIITKDKTVMKKIRFLKLIPDVEKNYNRIENLLNKKDD